jgi:F-type H+-transporting ATPase subunit b
LKLSIRNRSFAIGFSVFLFFFSLAVFSGSVARAQAAPESQPAQAGASESTPNAAPENSAAPIKAAAPEEKKAEDSESETAAFRHSPVVQKLASILHLPIETAAKLFEFINFGILAFSILYFVVKFLPGVFRNRKAALQKQLVDARSATDVANDRLNGVEQRLARLDQDIDAIRKQVEQDASQDEARIKAALEEERLRIVESAGHEIEAAGAAAQRELKRFAAELAIERATGQLSLTPETDRKLVQNFARGLGNNNQGGRN